MWFKMTDAHNSTEDFGFQSYRVFLLKHCAFVSVLCNTRFSVRPNCYLISPEQRIQHVLLCLNSWTYSLLEKFVDFCHCFVTELQKLLGWKGPRDHLAQPCCSSSVSDSKLTISSWLWNVSTDHRLCDFSGQSVSVFNHTHSKKRKCFLVFGRNSMFVCLFVCFHVY